MKGNRMTTVTGAGLSPVHAEIDFDAPGRQHGYLRVPHSVDDSAYGWIGVPIVTINGAPGPTALLMAGNHGDEYEGQIALTRLCQTLEPDDIVGRLLILPMANPPAAEAGKRCSPIDGGNLNRSFPGDPRGTPTEMIAHYVEEVLMPMADWFFDFHSGGTSLCYPATFLRCPGHTPDERARLLSLQAAFDAPFAWVFTGGGGPASTARTAMGAAGRKGATPMMAELGGGGAVSRDILALTERGIRRMLHAIGMLPDHVPEAPHGTRELNVAGSLHAYESGVFEPLKDVGEAVAKGEDIAAIHHPDTPWKPATRLPAPHAGIILAKRALGRVTRGDCLYQIAREAKEND